jgi:hypothetical protein
MLIIVVVRELGLECCDESVVQQPRVGGGSAARLLHEHVGVVQQRLKVNEQSREASALPPSYKRRERCRALEASPLVLLGVERKRAQRRIGYASGALTQAAKLALNDWENAEPVAAGRRGEGDRSARGWRTHGRQRGCCRATAD